MQTSAIWLEKYSNRYRWAYRAYQKFVDEMDPSLAGNLTYSNRVTIAVYGTTQVGKTTLILDLLGITNEALERASNVLRGDQRIGKSSTTCAIRYGRSKNDSWYIGNARDALDDEAARVRFAALRTELEAGGAHSTDALSVLLPSILFRESEALSLDLRILDIPGINAVNEAEQTHVARVAEKHVATADLILLVGRADDLGFLHPNRLKLAALSDWMLQPNRYRVVLSYTFSSISFKNWFSQDKRTLGQVREMLFQELNTHDYSPPKSIEAILYPLEFGDSLRSLEAIPEYHQTAVALIQQLRHELLVSITKSASPYGRLASAFKMKALIDSRLEREQAHYHKQREVLKNEHLYALNKLEQTKELLKDYLEEREQLNRQKRRLHLYSKLHEKSDIHAYFTQPLPSTRQSVSALKSLAARFEQGIQAKWKRMCERHAHHQGNFRLAELTPPSTSELNKFYRKMDDYIIDSYWSEDNFILDRRMLLHAAEKIVNIYSQSASNEINKYITEQSKILFNKLLNNDNIINKIRNNIEIYQNNAIIINNNCNNIEYDYTIFKEKMKFSIDNSHKFEGYVLKYFQAELRRTREAIRHPTTAIEQVYDVFYLRLLLGELDKMLEGKKF